ncbi:4-hydroxy-tetrahydrodipicolinate synthase [Nonlabens sp. MB-3u-79]|jgi:4-hydroxy-tetrahydrodipicolinate synthase|uniref:4-hydroxy-tetrahydrodipicolinate synthase n=1 Tax=Nonlabens sp. MB-3u-79 TaxID=2058134 RepID=UPI000C3056DE|nr:4-hydroxy-tetrahydrodipicolinate synthase [Nonlabens sp. MB-3u-79]AUC80402.1 4-hydroxy-tetrahydrodipicolinate synthase [Nonlabens sp. MB-3u-79]|tara:strand:+ start:35805 stop:36683 length:879 start_codon:yes stop_codon:yes gene_type:complete
MQEIIGTGVALVTPFNAQGTVDHEALARVVNYQVENGVDYLVVLGTTGESVTLSKQEKKEVIHTIQQVNDGRLPLVIGIGGNDTAVVVNELKAADLKGFVAILSVSPSYNKPTQEGIYQHFKAVSEASPLPIILYNVPGRTASNMSVETVVRLAAFENVVAIKEAAGDLVQAMKMIQYTPKDFLVISGDDMIANAMTLAGGAGVISVIGQAMVQDFSDMIRYALNGDVEESYELHYKMASVIDMIFEQGNPAGIKALLNHLELCSDKVRLPLVKADDSLQNRLKTFLEQYEY